MKMSPLAEVFHGALISEVPPLAPSALADTLESLGFAAKQASRVLALVPSAQKNRALVGAAEHIIRRQEDILAANGQDMAYGRAKGLSAAALDRLALTPARIQAMADGLHAIADLPEPVGRITATFTRPNGLIIERVATPLGVIGVIYESRPNVTADAGGLCLKSGNSVILRGGSESFHSSHAIHACLVEGLRAAGLPEAAICLIPTRERMAVDLMLQGLGGSIDVLVPRGGKSLVAKVQEGARIPVFAHLEGNNHVYVEASADEAMACALVKNAKMRRTGICGAAETLLLDAAGAPRLLAPLVKTLLEAGCAVRGDAATQACDPRITPAIEEDWATEYLDAIIAVKVVANFDAALAHIARYGSHHTDCIVTEDGSMAARFLREVDSAIVLHNASTQFADGGEFGFGGEIGIATGKFHARGPVGVEQLASFKYRVHGMGQVRP